MDEGIPECDCPQAEGWYPGIKDHIPDCSRVKWIADMTKRAQEDLNNFPSSGSGFIGTPSMSDITSLRELITALVSRIDELEERVDRLDDTVTYGD